MAGIDDSSAQIIDDSFNIRRDSMYIHIHFKINDHATFQRRDNDISTRFPFVERLVSETGEKQAIRSRKFQPGWRARKS